MILKCAACGWHYDPDTEADRRDAVIHDPFRFVPFHYAKAGRAGYTCPGVDSAPARVPLKVIDSHES